jgi:NADP-dependent 3-hydroxy acid dehydrogenase YdfG
VCARSGTQVEAVATEIGGEWMQVDVSDRASVERNGCRGRRGRPSGRERGCQRRSCVGAVVGIDLDEWWQVYEVNVLGVTCAAGP